MKPRRQQQRSLTVAELDRLAFCHSPKLPQTINLHGIRFEWIGIGWDEQGPARGTEEAIVTGAARVRIR